MFEQTFNTLIELYVFLVDHRWGILIKILQHLLILSLIYPPPIWEIMLITGSKQRPMSGSGSENPLLKKVLFNILRCLQTHLDSIYIT